MAITHSCKEATNHRVWVTRLIVGPRFDNFSFILIHHAGMPGGTESGIRLVVLSHSSNPHHPFDQH